jgi:8-hydroxy-5-deazaflavin:NADPH oxidoreductase
MKVTIVGAGRLGTGLTRQLVAHGHEVMLTFTRNAERLEAAAKLFGAVAGTLEMGSQFGDVIALTTQYSSVAEALAQMQSMPARTILWDCTTPLKADFSGLLLGTTTSAGEEIAALAPTARVVKAIPVFAESLHDGSVAIAGKKPNIFVCGDDPAACGIVGTLVADIGAEPIVLSGLG